jgi:hypothetical protein
MSDINNPHPPDKANGAAPGGAAPQPPPPSGGFTKFYPSSNGLDAFKKFFGPKKWKAFQNNLCRSIGNQIKADQKIADLASRKLKAAAKGEDPDDITM